MTVELLYLSLSAVLAATLWVPYIIGVNKYPSKNINEDFKRPRDLYTVPPWVHRSHRAHLNLLEQLLPMALLVLVAAQINASNTIMVWCVILFFWIRVAHAIGMISGYAGFPIRPILFVSGWICILVFAWQLLSSF